MLGDGFFVIALPLSLALAGPVATVAGVRQTLVGGGLLGAAAMALFVPVPGVQNVRQGRDEATA